MVYILTFLQQGDIVAGTDWIVHPGILCCRCQNKGHYFYKCPEHLADQAGTQVSGTVNLTIEDENPTVQK